MLGKIFLDHPSSVDETYLEHAAFALWFAGWLFLAAGAALIHAIIPAAFEKTASGIIAKLYHRTQNRSGPAADAAPVEG
ncbi:MAG: DUF6356 family protein [Pseudomonadota bacterium]